MKLMTRPFLTLLLLATLSPLGAASGDWPQWRGPNRDGISTETGLLKSWPAEGPELLWKSAGIGSGFATVAISGGRIYTTGDDGDSSYIYALDLDGKKLWSVRLGKSGAPGNYAGTRGTPAVYHDALYALGQFGDLVCVNAATGQEAWRKNLDDDLDGRVGGWGYSESPLIDGIRLICTPGGSDGAIAALNRLTGDVIWRSENFEDQAEYASTVAVTIGGEPQYVQLTGNSVVGISRQGKLLWRADRDGSVAIIPTPIVSDNLVYVTSGYGVGCDLFRITKSGGGFQVEEVYTRNKAMVNHHGGVILLDGHLYGYSEGKGWTCQNLRTGEAVWAEKKLGKGAIAYADGRFYLRAEGKGTLVLIEATTRGYNETGRFEQPDRSSKNAWPHPVIAGGRLYLRDQDILLCYDVKAAE